MANRGGSWTNSDGLLVGFGTREIEKGYLTVTSQKGNRYTGQMVISYSGLEDTDSVTTASPGLSPHAVTIPRGSLITDARLVTVTAFDSAGDAGTLDIGTYSVAAVVDVADGIDVDIAQGAIDAVGESVACNGALVGGTVPVGATSNSDVVVVAAYQTAAFTAGEAVLYLEWVQPVESNSSLAA